MIITKSYPRVLPSSATTKGMTKKHSLSIKPHNKTEKLKAPPILNALTTPVMESKLISTISIKNASVLIPNHTNRAYRHALIADTKSSIFFVFELTKLASKISLPANFLIIFLYANFVFAKIKGGFSILLFNRYVIGYC